MVHNPSLPFLPLREKIIELNNTQAPRRFGAHRSRVESNAN